MINFEYRIHVRRCSQLSIYKHPAHCAFVWVRSSVRSSKTINLVTGLVLRPSIWVLAASRLSSHARPRANRQHAQERHPSAPPTFPFALPSVAACPARHCGTRRPVRSVCPPPMRGTHRIGERLARHGVPSPPPSPPPFIVSSSLEEGARRRQVARGGAPAVVEATAQAIGDWIA